MNKNQLIKKVAEENDLTASNVKLVVDLFLGELKKGVLESGRIALPGFGIFKKNVSKERAGVNPQTMAKITIPSKTTIKFKQSE